MLNLLMRRGNEVLCVGVRAKGVHCLAHRVRVVAVKPQFCELGLHHSVYLKADLALNLNIGASGRLELASAFVVLDLLLQVSILCRKSRKVRVQDQQFCIDTLHVSSAKFFQVIFQ